METRIRAYDWERHPLGAMATWSPALRAALTTCQAARSPMQIWWGASAYMFYNGAYIPWLGERHPNALGLRAADVYGSRWPDLRAGLQRVYVESDAVEADGMLLTPLFAGSGIEGVVCTFAQDRVGDDVLTDVSQTVQRSLRALAQLAATPLGSSVKEIATAVDDLLDITRLGHGRLRLERAPISLEEIVKDAVHIAELETSVASHTAGIKVWADQARLARALATVLTRTRPAVITLSVADDVAHIELESTADAASADYGPARRMIEVHDGIIRETDSHYSIALPVAGLRHKGPVRRWRVLIVEDDEIAARTTQMLLEQLGYAVAIAHDGAVALEVARVFVPDVALVDIGLPVIDGWEVARRLRERFGALPVIAVTGLHGEKEKQRSFDAGFIDHLLKPLDLDVLDRRLSDIKESSTL